MDEFTWITLCVIFLQISEVTGENVFVRNGSDATLPCGSVIDGPHKCGHATWNFVRKKTTVELVAQGKIKPEFQSDRLDVTANCSLLIKNVTREIVGRYTCQQFRNNDKYGGDAEVHLSVVTLTEHQYKNEIKITCSVWTYEPCEHKVKWQFVKKNEKYSQDTSTVGGICSTTIKCRGCKPENSDSLICEVTETNQKDQTVHQFPFKSSDQKTVSGFPLWAMVAIPSGLAALVIITVALVIWKRNKGNEEQMGEGTVADPEDAVPYASVHFSKKASKDGAQIKNDDDDDAVTYSTVKAFSSSAADSCDSSILYATVNKPK